MEWLLYWHWFALALVLITAETLGAAGFLLVLGVAAFSIGVFTWAFNISWEWQLVGFSIASIAFAFIWWQCLKRRTENAGPLINRPIESMLGRTATLIDAIENGRGKIRINDAYWFVTGPELPVGTVVKIVGIEEGTLLLVQELDNAIDPQG